MATLIPSAFSRYSLTEREELEGQVLSFNQKAVIQNHLADIVQEKLDYPFDPLNPQNYVQKEAELQGQMKILQMLLSVSEDSEEKLRAINMEGNPELDEHNRHLGNPFEGAMHFPTSDSNQS